MTKYPSGVTNDYNCAAAPNYGQRGVTYWAKYGPYSFSLSPNNGSTNISFSCDVPKCYQGKGVCNVVYKFGISGSSAGNDVGPLQIFLNNQSINTPNYHSRIQGHDVMVAVDLTPSPNLYNDTGLNTLTFYNQDTQVTANISNFLISRTYAMCSVPFEDNACCTAGNPCNKSPPCDPGSGWPQGGNGSFDGNRLMIPCNREGGGGRGVANIHYANQDDIYPRNSQVFNFYSNATASNYISRDQCLFNFNRIALDRNQTNGDDVQFNVLINGTYATTYYHSKVQGHDIWPTIDLASYASYSDTGYNNITLYNNDTTVHIYTDPGGQDLYRIYYTQAL
jgi:hypothetical protein